MNWILDRTVDAVLAPIKREARTLRALLAETAPPLALHRTALDLVAKAEGARNFSDLRADVRSQVEAARDLNVRRHAPALEHERNVGELPVPQRSAPPCRFSARRAAVRAALGLVTFPHDPLATRWLSRRRERGLMLPLGPCHCSWGNRCPTWPAGTRVDPVRVRFLDRLEDDHLTEPKLAALIGDISATQPRFVGKLAYVLANPYWPIKRFAETHSYAATNIDDEWGYIYARREQLADFESAFTADVLWLQPSTDAFFVISRVLRACCDLRLGAIIVDPVLNTSLSLEALNAGLIPCDSSGRYSQGDRPHIFALPLSRDLQDHRRFKPLTPNIMRPVVP